MVSSKALIASLFVAIVAFYVVHSYEMVYNNGHGISRSLLQNIDCGSACEARCKESSRQKICLRACGTCCARCGCVPPGTSGNENVCPCYANMTTHDGKHKCP